MYQEVMRNPNISAEAKAIYAYLASIAGTGNTCYPSIDTMQREMCMSKNRLTKYMGQLIAAGVVEKVRERNGNIYGHNIYKITHEAEVIEDLNHIFENCEIRTVENEAVENEAVEIRTVENEVVNNNNSNNNNSNNNSIEYQQIANLYNSICVSFPKLTKLSDKRKKSIRARFSQGYTLDDFKRVFELAEGSRFLKGGNSRNWQATFDWMITDANMAKVLDGNYTDRKTGDDNATATDQSRGTTRDFYEQFMGTGNRD